MTKGEYLRDLQSQANRYESKFAKGGSVLRILMPVIMVIGSVAICYMGMHLTRAAQENASRAAYNRALENMADIGIDSLAFQDIFDTWCDTEIGNDANTLLSRGAILFRSDISVLPSKDANEFTITKGSRTIDVINDSISYINVWDNKVIYRSNTTRSIHEYDISAKKDSVLLEKPVGEIFVAGNQIYFVDCSDNNHMYSLTIGENSPVVLIEEPVDRFVVIGRNVLYLKTDGVLCYYNAETGTTEELASGVKNYFLGNGLILEAGSTIYQFEVNGNNLKEIYVSDDPSMKLSGVDHGIIYFSESGKLYAINEENKKCLISSEHQAYESLKVSNGKIMLLACVDSTHADARWELIEVQTNMVGD